MMSRDFLARIEGLKIEIQPDIMREISEQLALWPEDRAIAYNSALAHLLREQTGYILEGLGISLGESPSGVYLVRAVKEGGPDLVDQTLADAISHFALAMLRVYQAKDLAGAQSEDDQAQA